MSNKLLVSFVLAVVACFFCGCAAVGQKGKDYGDYWFRPIHVSPAESENLNLPYRTTNLGKSTSAEILEVMVNNATEVLSQSESVVASYGSDHNRQKAWFNMVSFDEEKLTAKRKYFLSSYDNPKEWFVLKEALRFDAEMFIDRAILDDAYANADAKRIAILKEIRRKYNQDIQEVTKYHRDLGNIGMLANQSMNIVLTEFELNPSYAEQMEYFEGFDFDHPTLDEGKIRMVIDQGRGIVKLKIKIGSVVDKWSQQKDVLEMEP